MGRSDGPSTRRSEHLKTMRSALERWRFKTHRDHYNPSPISCAALLPDTTLSVLASNARIRTLQDMASMVNPPWVMGRRHGAEVLELIKRVDSQERATRESAKEAKRKERRKETEARQAAKKREQDETREIKRAEKAREKAAKDAAKEQEKELKQQAKEAARLEKLQQRAAEKAAKSSARPTRPPLVGASVFNATPTTTIQVGI